MAKEITRTVSKFLQQCLLFGLKCTLSQCYSSLHLPCAPLQSCSCAPCRLKAGIFEGDERAAVICKSESGVEGKEVLLLHKALCMDIPRENPCAPDPPGQPQSDVWVVGSGWLVGGKTKPGGPDSCSENGWRENRRGGVRSTYSVFD